MAWGIVLRTSKLLIVLSMGLSAYGQNSQNADSLRKIYHSNQPDSIRLHALVNLTLTYAFNDTDSAILLANQSIEFAKRLKDTASVCNSYQSLGIAYGVKGDTHRAIETFRKMNQLANKANIPYSIAASLENIGHTYMNMGDDLKAIEYFHTAYDVAVKNNLNSDVVYICFNLGMLYSNYDIKIAHDYLDIAIQKGTDFDSRYYHDYAIVETGWLLLKQEKTDELEDFIRGNEKSLKTDESIYDLKTLNGYLLIEQQKFIPAIQQFDQVIEWCDTDFADLTLAKAQIGKANALFGLNKVRQSIIEYEAAEKIADQLDNLELKLSASEGLYESYSKLGNAEKALNYLRQVHDLEKQRLQKETIQQVTQREMTFNFRQKTIQDSLKAQLNLSLEQERSNSLQRRNSYIIWGSVLIILIILIFLMYAYRAYQKARAQKNVIRQQEELLRKDYLNLKEFTENASHEMQTPMAVIQSKIESLLQTAALTEAQLNHVQSIHRATHRMSKTNRALLLIAKIENGQFPVDSDVNFSGIATNFIEEFHELIESKEIDLNLQIDTDVIITGNEFLMETIFGNLLRNSFVHNISGGFIEVVLTSEHLVIRNSGKDLEIEPYLLFERFKKAGDYSDSSGLGLSIVHKACNALNWTLTYEQADQIHALTIYFNGLDFK